MMVQLITTNYDTLIIRRRPSINQQISKSRPAKVQKQGLMGLAMPKLVQYHILHDEKAVVLQSSTLGFGDECLRLVNIAFQTSKIFPSIMSTYGDIIHYLQTQLQQYHPRRYFHIIINENNSLGFDFDENTSFAEIKQEQYRLLIFSTKRRETIKMDTGDMNLQTKLRWNSVQFEQIDD